MPTEIPWSEDELQSLSSTPGSQIVCELKRIPVVLQPFHLQNLKSSVRDLLNASVNTYAKSLDGILLSYKNLKVLSKSAPVAAETSGVAVEIQADFYVLRPEIGCVSRGTVNKISKDHVGVLLYSRFNISCPRPTSEARSLKWLGNDVIMHQDVTVKLKEMNFSGKLPFFKGKLVAVGDVPSKAVKEVDVTAKPKKKRKDKETGAESLSLPESSSTVSLKSGKRKLIETDGNFKSPSKKAKEDPESRTMEQLKDPVIEYSSNALPLNAPSSKKKKKKVSLGVQDGLNFNPSMSLDLSQLPEDLPAPNADSTHFDLTRNLHQKSEKKRRKNCETGLSLLKSDPSEALKDLSHVSSKHNVESSGKRKDKKDKKSFNEVNKTKDQPSSSLRNPDWDKSKISPKKNIQLSPQVSSTLKSLSKIEKSVKIHPDSPKKKKQHVSEPIRSEQNQPKESGLAKNRKTIIEDFEDISKQKKLKTHQSDEQQLTYTKGKKSKKSKIEDVPTLTNPTLQDKQTTGGVESSFSHISTLTKDLLSSPKSKNKYKEDERDPQPNKYTKNSKEKANQDIDLDIYDDGDSDDTIPPGQKVVNKSPLKSLSQICDSPQKREFSAFNSGKKIYGFFASGTSMTDYDLGVSKGARPLHIMFDNVEDKLIISPPESPMKSSSQTQNMSVPLVSKPDSPEKTPVKTQNKNVHEHDSDSDTPQRKKVVIFPSVKKELSCSDSDSDSGKLSTLKSGSNHIRKEPEDSSDSSDFDTAVKSKILESMGVMQSPLKLAKQKSKKDNSDSGSDSNVDNSEMYKNSTYSNKQVSLSLSHGGLKKTNSKKLTLNDKTSDTAKKLANPLRSKSVSEPSSVSESKDHTAPLTQPGDGDSDSDFEIMKTALMQLEQEKLLGIPSRTNKRKLSTDKKTVTRNHEIPKNTSAVKKSPAIKKKAAGAPNKKTNFASDAIIKERPSFAKNVSNVSNDSDSGPEDRNTTFLLEQMRQKLTAEGKTKKKAVERQVLVNKDSSLVLNQKSKKLRSSKKVLKPKPVEAKSVKSTKGSRGKEVTGSKKERASNKNKSKDDELSDVIQRLMQQAKLNVGLT